MKENQNILTFKTNAFQTERFCAVLQAHSRVISNNNYAFVLFDGDVGKS